MPPESQQDVQSPQSEQSASTPQQPVADKQTTAKTNDLRGIMDHLDLPDAVRDRIAPKEEQPVAEVAAEPESPEPVTSEEPQAEVQAEEPDEQGEDEPEEVAAEQPQKVDGRQKRINRLTRQKSQLEEQLDKVAIENQRLREQLGQNRPPEMQPAPLIGGNLPAIQQQISAQDAILAWCDDNPDGGQIGEGDKAQFVEGKEIRSWRRDAELKRQRAVVQEGKEMDRLAAVRQQADQEAFAICPDMFDRSKPEYQEAVAYIRDRPEIVNIPEANRALAYMIIGRKTVQAQQSKNGKENGQKKHRDIDERVFTNPRVPIAPHTPEPPSRESKQSSQKKYSEAMSNHIKDPEGNHLAEAFGALSETNRSAITPRTPVKV